MRVMSKSLARKKMRSAISWALILSFSFARTVFGEIPRGAFPQTSFTLPDSIEIPSHLGRIEESSLSKSEQPLIVYIQDAHGLVDAQNNIAGLVEYLQEAYGIHHLALEGNEGYLDPFLFRHFPDRQILKKTMQNYLQRGELTGAEYALIDSQKEMKAFGIEDWKIYEANYQAYLKAVQNKSAALAKMKNFQDLLDVKRSQVFSKELNLYFEKVLAFRDEKIPLDHFLDILKGFWSKEELETHYPHLSVLLKALAQSENSEQLSQSVTKLSCQFKVKWLHLLNSDQRREFNSRYQDYRTGRSDDLTYLHYLVATGQALSLKPKLTRQMQRALGRIESLETIRGSAVFDELQILIKKTGKWISKTSAEKRIIKKYDDLELLKGLIKLELSSDQYQDLKRRILAISKMAKEIGADIKWPIEFYEKALSRDVVFHEKITRFSENEKAEAVIVLTGGFHRKGFEAWFEKEKMPYVVISPRIGSLAGKDNYERVMTQNVSYKKYLQDGFYQAFHKHASEELMRSLDQPSFKQTLKLWRDNVIQDLAVQGRVGKSSSYTCFIDCLFKVYSGKYGTADLKPIDKSWARPIIEKELDQFRSKILSHLWAQFQDRFGTFKHELKALMGKKAVDKTSAQLLLNQFSQTDFKALSSVGVLQPSLALLPSSRSELRERSPQSLEYKLLEQKDSWFELLTVEDQELVRRIISNTLPDQIPDRMTIDQRSNVLNGSVEGRSVYLKLQKSVVIAGKKISMLRIKGTIPYFENKILKAYQGTGFVPFPFAVSPKGEIGRAPGTVKGIGVSFLKGAESEYNNMKKALSAGINVDIPLAIGRYENLQFRNIDLGFLICGIEGETESDVRVALINPETDAGLDDWPDGTLNPGNVFREVILFDEVLKQSQRNLTEQQAQDFYKNLGRDLRNLHDRLGFHRFPHVGNIGVNSQLEVIFRDMGTVVEKSSLEGPFDEKLKQEIAYRFLDLTTILKNLTSKTKMTVMSDGEEGFYYFNNNNLILPFMEGYFAEIPESLRDVFEPLNEKRGIDYALDALFAKGNPNLKLNLDEDGSFEVLTQAISKIVNSQNQRSEVRSGQPVDFDGFIANELPRIVEWLKSEEGQRYFPWFSDIEIEKYAFGAVSQCDINLITSGKLAEGSGVFAVRSMVSAETLALLHQHPHQSQIPRDNRLIEINGNELKIDRQVVKLVFYLLYSLGIKNVRLSEMPKAGAKMFQLAVNELDYSDPAISNAPDDDPQTIQLDLSKLNFGKIFPPTRQITPRPRRTGFFKNLFFPYGDRSGEMSAPPAGARHWPGKSDNQGDGKKPPLSLMPGGGMPKLEPSRSLDLSAFRETKKGGGQNITISSPAVPEQKGEGMPGWQASGSKSPWNGYPLVPGGSSSQLSTAEERAQAIVSRIQKEIIDAGLLPWFKSVSLVPNTSGSTPYSFALTPNDEFHGGHLFLQLWDRPDNQFFISQYYDTQIPAAGLVKEIGGIERKLSEQMYILGLWIAQVAGFDALRVDSAEAGFSRLLDSVLKSVLRKNRNFIKQDKSGGFHSFFVKLEDLDFSEWLNSAARSEVREEATRIIFNSVPEVTASFNPTKKIETAAPSIIESVIENEVVRLKEVLMQREKVTLEEILDFIAKSNPRLDPPDVMFKIKRVDEAENDDEENEGETGKTVRELVITEDSDEAERQALIFLVWKLSERLRHSINIRFQAFLTNPITDKEWETICSLKDLEEILSEEKSYSAEIERSDISEILNKLNNLLLLKKEIVARLIATKTGILTTSDFNQEDMPHIVDSLLEEPFKSGGMNQFYHLKGLGAAPLVASVPKNAHQDSELILIRSISTIRILNEIGKNETLKRFFPELVGSIFLEDKNGNLKLPIIVYKHFGKGKDYFLKKGEKRLEAGVLEELIQVGKALKQLNERHILHRDIKPSNIFLREQAQSSPLIADLEFAIKLPDLEETEVERAIREYETANNINPGTLVYAPLSRNYNQDGRRDIAAFVFTVIDILNEPVGRELRRLNEAQVFILRTESNLKAVLSGLKQKVQSPQEIKLIEFAEKWAHSDLNQISTAKDPALVDRAWKELLEDLQKLLQAFRQKSEKDSLDASRSEIRLRHEPIEIAAKTSGVLRLNITAEEIVNEVVDEKSYQKLMQRLEREAQENLGRIDAELKAYLAELANSVLDFAPQQLQNWANSFEIIDLLRRFPVKNTLFEQEIKNLMESLIYRVYLYRVAASPSDYARAESLSVTSLPVFGEESSQVWKDVLNSEQFLKWENRYSHILNGKAPDDLPVSSREFKSIVLDLELFDFSTTAQFARFKSFASRLNQRYERVILALPKNLQNLNLKDLLLPGISVRQYEEGRSPVVVVQLGTGFNSAFFFINPEMPVVLGPQFRGRGISATPADVSHYLDDFDQMLKSMEFISGLAKIPYFGNLFEKTRSPFPSLTREGKEALGSLASLITQITSSRATAVAA